MTRHALRSLVTVAALLTLAGCSGPEAPAALGTPPPARPTPVPVSVLVQVAEGAGPLAEAWAEELRTAVSAGHGDLSLASAAEAAAVVVRIDRVETGVEVPSEEELRKAVAAGDGGLSLAPAPDGAAVVEPVDEVPTGEDAAAVVPVEMSIMRGALVVGGTAREFTLRYPGPARPQAEALARNLRGFAAEGGTDEPADEPAAGENTEDAETETEG